MITKAFRDLWYIEIPISEIIYEYLELVTISCEHMTYINWKIRMNIRKTKLTYDFFSFPKTTTKPINYWNIVRTRKWSLDACVGYAKVNDLFSSDLMVCTKTLYNAVWSGALELTPFELPEALQPNLKKARVRKNKKVLWCQYRRTSIRGIRKSGRRPLGDRHCCRQKSW